ncbi:MAG: glycosyltransferase family 4 protein [Acidimicrobiales bacterium]
MTADFEFLGQITDDEKRSLIKGSDVFCVPSLVRRVSGVVLIEAMAAGTPVVASDIPAHCMVSEGGRVGACFPPATPGACRCPRRGLGRKRCVRSSSAPVIAGPPVSMQEPLAVPMSSTTSGRRIDAPHWRFHAFNLPWRRSIGAGTPALPLRSKDCVVSSETKKTIALGALLLGLGLTIPLVLILVLLGLPGG